MTLLALGIIGVMAYHGPYWPDMYCWTQVYVLSEHIQRNEVTTIKLVRRYRYFFQLYEQPLGSYDVRSTFRSSGAVRGESGMFLLFFIALATPVIFCRDPNSSASQAKPITNIFDGCVCGVDQLVTCPQLHHVSFKFLA